MSTTFNCHIFEIIYVHFYDIRWYTDGTNTWIGEEVGNDNRYGFNRKKTTRTTITIRIEAKTYC